MRSPPRRPRGSTPDIRPAVPLLSCLREENRRTSETQIRVPLMQGLPPQILGSMVIRSRRGFTLLPRMRSPAALPPLNGSIQHSPAEGDPDLPFFFRSRPPRAIDRSLGLSGRRPLLFPNG